MKKYILPENSRVRLAFRTAGNAAVVFVHTDRSIEIDEVNISHWFIPSENCGSNIELTHEINMGFDFKDLIEI